MRCGAIYNCIVGIIIIYKYPTRSYINYNLYNYRELIIIIHLIYTYIPVAQMSTGLFPVVSAIPRMIGNYLKPTARKKWSVHR